MWRSWFATKPTPPRSSVTALEPGVECPTVHQRVLMPLPTRLTLAGLLLVGSLVAMTIGGAGRIGLAAVCRVCGLGFGLNVWGLHDDFLDELQGRRIVVARRRRVVAALLCVVGFVLVVVAMVIFFTSQPGLHTQ
jgi:hypothetical protein